MNMASSFTHTIDHKNKLPVATVRAKLKARLMESFEVLKALF